MSGISHIGSIMNMVGMTKDLASNMMPQTSGAAKAGFETDLLSLSPMANILQQLADMDLQEPGERGELDLGGLAQLKQRGEMLANMLKMKLKNFESGLVSGMKDAGLNPSQDMSLKNGDQGLFLLNDLPDKNAIEMHLKSNGKLQEQFKELSQMANILEMLGQIDSGGGTGRRTGMTQAVPAAQYAQQSQQTKPTEKRTEAEFVVNVLSGNVSYAFE